MPRRKPAPPPPSDRDSTKQETREALLLAGMELFAKQGLDAPSLDSICARAGFTRGAFYVHFADRESFIVAVMESATASFLDAILATRGAELDLAGTIAAFAGAVAGGSFGAFGKLPLHQVLTACARSRALRGRYVEILERTRERLASILRASQHAERVRDDIDAVQAAGLLIAIGLGVGVMLELRVPFDAAPHAGTLTALLAPR